MKVVCSAVIVNRTDPRREWLAYEAEKMGGEVAVVGDEIICECYDDDYSIIKLFENMPIHSIVTC